MFSKASRGNRCGFTGKQQHGKHNELNEVTVNERKKTKQLQIRGVGLESL